MAAAHPSSTATHASSTHTASATHAVTAPAGAVTAVVLARVLGVSVRRLIGIGQYPLATEIHGRIRHGRYRRGSKQTKQKHNTHAHILLPDDFPHRYQRTSASGADLAGEKRGNQT